MLPVKKKCTYTINGIANKIANTPVPRIVIDISEKINTDAQEFKVGYLWTQTINQIVERILFYLCHILP